jgi:hypothetical protein
VGGILFGDVSSATVTDADNNFAVKDLEYILDYLYDNAGSGGTVLSATVDITDTSRWTLSVPSNVARHYLPDGVKVSRDIVFDVNGSSYGNDVIFGPGRYLGTDAYIEARLDGHQWDSGSIAILHYVYDLVAEEMETVDGGNFPLFTNTLTELYSGNLFEDR